MFLGVVEEAFDYLDQAASTLADDDGSLYLRSGVRWLQGELALLLGQNGQAAEHFVAVWDAYLDLEVGPLEVTLISLRIAKAYLLGGDRSAFRQVLQDLVSRAEEVRRSNPLLAPILGELVRESAEGTVTAKLLEKIYLEMREGAPNAPPLLPSSLSR